VSHAAVIKFAPVYTAKRFQNPKFLLERLPQPHPRRRDAAARQPRREPTGRGRA
jgi:hypothetical protein